MTEKPIRVELEFTSDEDPELGNINTVALPRAGDLIRTPHNIYQVDRILFNNINVKMGCVVTAVVSPYSAPESLGKTEG